MHIFRLAEQIDAHADHKVEEKICNRLHVRLTSSNKINLIFALFSDPEVLPAAINLD